MVEAGKCVHIATPGRGATPSQCRRDSQFFPLVLAADKSSREMMPICQEHYSALAARKQGSIFRDGASAPVQVKLIAG